MDLSIVFPERDSTFALHFQSFISAPKCLSNPPLATTTLPFALKTHILCAMAAKWMLGVLLLAVLLPGIALAAPRRSVAIIGAGIGGATTSYYVSKAARSAGLDPYEIHVFEKANRVGGRIRSFSVVDEPSATSQAAKSPSSPTNNAKVDSKSVNAAENASTPQTLWFELGAAVWASPNLLLDDLSRELDILVDASNENAGTEDLSAVVYEGGPQGRFYELALGDPSEPQTLRVAAQMEKFKAHLLQNYLEYLPRDYGLQREIEEHKYQPRISKVSLERTKPWSNISEWSRHGRIDAFTTTTTRDYLHAHGVSYNYTDHHIEPFTRVIYDQGASANAFAGFAALVSADQTRVAVHGLQQMVADILTAAEANLHLNAHIESVSRITPAPAKGPKFEISLSNGGKYKFDSVVIAAPIEYLSDIRFENLPSIDNIERRAYVGKTSTYVRAKSLNWKSLKVPQNTTALLTNEKSDLNDVGFFSIVPHHKFNNGEYLFKVFSRKSMAQMPGSMERWFSAGAKVVESQDWQYTFPVLTPPTPHVLPPHCRSHNSLVDGLSEFQPIVLEDDLYYTSAIDSVAVAMEASTLAAHNVAQLIVHGASDPHAAPTKQTPPPAATADAKVKPTGPSANTFQHSEIERLLRSYLSDEAWTVVVEMQRPLKQLYELGIAYITGGDVYLLSWIALGVVYGGSDLVWIRPRFNAFWLFALLCIGHTFGYWYEYIALSVTGGDVGEVHAHATIIAAEIFAGILVAIGTWLGDAILPLAMLARTVVRLDKWAGAGAIAGVALWPALSDHLFAALSLVSRFYGGPLPSLSLLDVNLSTAMIVSGSLLVFGIVSSQFSSHSTKTIFVLAPILALTHLGFLFSGEFLGSTSLWALLVPSHAASYLHQDGLSAIIDPLSSTQTLILIIVPLFLIGAHAGSALTKLFPLSDDALPHAPRFCGPLRLLGGFLLVLGMAFHSGSYQFLASFCATTTLLGLI